MKGYTYGKTKEGYILYFPELLNVRMPKKQYLGPDTEPITLTDKMMDDLCRKLNNGEIELIMEDLDFKSQRFRLNINDNNGEFSKIFPPRE